jgi:hypothetical protein
LVPAVLAALLLARPAAAEPCAAAEQPRFEIATEHGAVAQDDASNLATLRRISAETNGAALRQHEHALGLYNATVNFKVAVASRIDETPHGFCAVPTAVTVRFELRNRVVHVARETAESPCLRQEVLAHERRHVRTDDGLIEAFAAILEQPYRDAARALQPMLGKTPEAARAKLTETLDGVNRVALDNFMTERARLQALIDSTDERDRFARICDGAALKLIGIAEVDAAALRGKAQH